MYLNSALPLRIKAIADEHVLVNVPVISYKLHNLLHRTIKLTRMSEPIATVFRLYFPAQTTSTKTGKLIKLIKVKELQRVM